MYNEEEDCLRTWVTFTRRTNDPKLRFLELCLDNMEVPHRRNDGSTHAPILQVPEDRLYDAWNLLDSKLTDQGREITVDDLDDDHPYFIGFFKMLNQETRDDQD